MKTTKMMATTAVLAALAVVLVTFVHFPLFPAAAFLEYDPGDIPILIGTCFMGIPAGIIITLIAAFVQGITVSAHSGIYGIIMHIISTTALLVFTCYTYKKTNKIIISTIVAAVATTIIMGVANLLITPHFMGVSVDVVKGMLLPAILPFNFIKSIVNAFLSLFIYKIIHPKFIKMGLF